MMHPPENRTVAILIANKVVTAIAGVKGEACRPGSHTAVSVLAKPIAFAFRRASLHKSTLIFTAFGHIKFCWPAGVSFLLSQSRIASQDYRDCMARFAGAVHIVASDGPAGCRGVTVSAVTSISDNPPMLLVCLNRNRPENAWFEKNGHFSLNTLCADQIGIARAFAGEQHLEMEERFALGRWRKLVTGSPVLEGARMALDCRVTQALEMATHQIVFGEVMDFYLPEGDQLPPALCYMDRGYREL